METVKFTSENTGMLLIDHQVGTMGWVGSLPFEALKSNALILANAAKIMHIPVVLTSSMEEYAQGPLLSELKDILPEAFEQRIKRMGIVNAMDDDNFRRAVEALGKKNLIVAGVTNDVCTVHPVLTLLSEGYNVQVVVDAGGSPTKLSDDIAGERMARNGAVMTGTNQLVAELVKDWTTPAGQQVIQVLNELVFSKMNQA